MKNVLIVVTSGILRGGVFTLLEEWIKYSPKGTYNYTLYYLRTVQDQEMYDKLENLGYKFEAGNYTITSESNIYNHFNEMKRIFNDISNVIRKNSIDIIQIVSANFIGTATAIYVARKMNVARRITYCINTSQKNKFFIKNFLNHLMKLISRPIINHNATILSACSRAAAYDFFGRKGKKALIINPCADCKKFIFSQSARDRIRKQYNVENNFVIGNMARLDLQKNHKFLIEIFKEVSNLYDNARLMLVGSGPLENEIREQVKKSGLTDKVIFCGSTDKPEDYFCAMDVFVFPCLFEGLGQVAIHAQNSGLITICSEEVPKETAVTELEEYLSLSDPPKKWAEKILSYKDGYERKNMYEAIKKADYDVSSIPKWINILYEE